MNKSLLSMGLAAVLAAVAYAAPNYGQSFTNSSGGVGGSDPMYNWTFTSGGDLVAFGTLDASSFGGGALLATDGTITFTGLGGYVDSGTGTLIADPGGNPALSPDNLFIEDDLIYPSSSPQVDYYGLLFQMGADEVNIWNDGGPTGIWSDGAGYRADEGVFALQSTPEPFTMVLGAGAVALAARRKLRKNAIA